MSTASEPQQSSEIALQMIIPGIDSFVDLIRTGVGRVAQLVGFTFDGIEDLALAVNEAAALLLDLAPRTLEVEVRAPSDVESAATVAMNAVFPRGEWPPRDLVSDVRWQVLTAVCSEVKVREDGQPGFVLIQGQR